MLGWFCYTGKYLMYLADFLKSSKNQTPRKWRMSCQEKRGQGKKGREMLEKIQGNITGPRKRLHNSWEFWQLSEFWDDWQLGWASHEPPDSNTQKGHKRAILLQESLSVSSTLVCSQTSFSIECHRGLRAFLSLHATGLTSNHFPITSPNMK